MLEILGHGGKVLVVINPAPPEISGTMENWVGSGAGLMSGDLNCFDQPTFMDADDARAQDLWHPLTAKQQAEIQGVPIVTSPESLYGDGTDEEWAGFDEALEHWRSEVVSPLSEDDFPHAA